MGDPTAAERMRRYRARRKERAPVEVEIRQRRVAAVADQFERDHAAAARLLAAVDPALGEALLAELNQRAVERAVGQAGAPIRAIAAPGGAGAQHGASTTTAPPMRLLPSPGAGRAGRRGLGHGDSPSAPSV